jgi:quercetin dioxygenase-like cupin family protein
MIRTSIVILAALSFLGAQPAQPAAPAQPAKESGPLKVRTLLQTDKAWDGKPYETYPQGRPQLSLLEITIPPHTKMDWHRHPIPNASYVV